jgi:glutathione synthase
MRHLFITDRLEALDVSGDSSLAFMLECHRRSIEVWSCEPRHLSIDGDRVVASTAHRVTVRREAGNHFTRHESATLPLDRCDVAWMRKDPPFDLDYYFSTLLLERTRGTTLLLNDPRGLREANEKLYIFNFPALIAPTLVTRDPERVRAFLVEHGEIVVKPLDGCGGAGVLQLRRDDRNVPALLDLLLAPGRGRSGTSWVMAQRYLPEAREGDKRILLIDGRPVGAMLRVPRGDDNRGNLHVGGRAEATTLTARDREICDAVGPRLVADGLRFVGLDVIGRYLTEVNVTSPTGIVQIDRLSGTDIARLVLDAVVT